MDAKHWDQCVKFEDDVEEKLESLETISPFAIPPDKVKVEPGEDDNNDNNSLVMTNQDMEEASNIASRTRSRTRLAFAVNAIDPVKTKSPGLVGLFKLLPYLVLFFLHNSVATATPSMPMEDLPDLGELEQQTYGQAMTNHLARMVEQLRYIHALDQLEDEEPDPTSYHGYNADLWSVTQVTNHCWKQKGSNQRIEVKVRFNDLNKSSAWVDMFALAMQDPVPILKYAHANHLTSKGPFKVLTKYCVGEAPSDLARAYKARTKPGSVKIKFGIQVPLGVKQAFNLDWANGNILWRDAI